MIQSEQIDTSPELRQLGKLDAELASVGVDAQIRDEIPALAVPTNTPGVYLWVFISPSGRRFACYLDCLREYLTTHPCCAARDIAAFARA